MSTPKTNARVWQPDSNTVIIGEQTKINQLAFARCCQKIESLMSKKNAPNHSEAICSYLDELLSKNVGAIEPTAKTLFGLDNIAHQNTDKRPILARIIADNVRLYLDGKLADTAKEIAFRCVDNWLAGIEAQEPTPTATDEQATAQQLPSELDNDRAKEYFAKAVEAGLMSEQFEWLTTQALLACFCREMSLNLDLGKGYSEGQKRLSWKPFEQLFNIKKGSLRGSLNDIQKTGQDPIGIEKINAIFQE